MTETAETRLSFVLIPKQVPYSFIRQLMQYRQTGGGRHLHKTFTFITGGHAEHNVELPSRDRLAKSLNISA